MNAIKINALDVKKIRMQTGAGVMDCKKALMESDGDFESAIAYLRKKGQKISQNRELKQLNQGYVTLHIDEKGQKIVILVLNCETDFVARTEVFQKNAKHFAEVAFNSNVGDVDGLLKERLDELTIKEHLDKMIVSIGENIVIGQVIHCETKGQFIYYVHPGNQIVALVEFSDVVEDSFPGKNVAMQIASMNPMAVQRKDVSQEDIDKELDIIRAQLVNSGTPEDFAEKAAQGKLEKFFQENVLLEQKYIKDNRKTVQQYLKQENYPDVVRFFHIKIG